ncbi:MAG: L-ribulose-5-phosphate 4-epimerase [Clostridiales bacterium]|jgi:L-ribulose-5-phosphate 4-epimerase|nr:L-ribulose-5-phosphate 4-epimerase [Clostridiales bacterium]
MNNKTVEQLKNEVYEANMLLPEYKLITFTWGNVSGADRERGIMVIKPSGVSYAALRPQDMVVVDLLGGKKISGDLNPSSDTPTHLELYRSFEGIGAVVHTHSRWATIFSQAKREIAPLGTTHADYFYGAIPVTRLMTQDEIKGEYEKETGKVIAETFKDKNPLEIPAVLVASHGPFAWGKDAEEAVHNAVVLEEIAFMAWHNIAADTEIAPMQRDLLDKHYLRKHGAGAYYGQK